ncbi:MAG: hypothetical protein ISS69_04655 [Phycisphaerae bacterium]|nr:hypothetical protein [Phycisphaerae bacterium]
MKTAVKIPVCLTMLCVFAITGTGLCFGKDAPQPGATSEEILSDWLMQDLGKDGANKCFKSKTDATAEAAAVQKASTELGTTGKSFTAAAAKLTASKVPGNDPKWKDLYTKACTARRAKRLAALRGYCAKIVFTRHYEMGGSHYAYTEGLSDAQRERHFRPGSALCLLDVTANAPAVETLIDSPEGVIRDPDVSYDGKRILFAWKKSDRQDDYHLYEMDVATRKVRQLTFGLGFADYEGCYLPDGNILFNSSRCVQIVDCWWTEVSNLYVCNKDGKFLRRLAFDQVHSNYPQVLDDGRVVYTRWDYNDRGQLYPQPLYQMNIDGTSQTEYYGNNSWFPTTIAHARGIPGTSKVMALATGHHTRQRGKLCIVDSKKGRQEASGVQLIAPIAETKSVRIDRYGQGGDQFQYPYPFSEKEFLTTFRGDRSRLRFGIYFMRDDATRELLAVNSKQDSNQPVPLKARKIPTIRPTTVDYRKKTGTFYVQDVYIGPGLKGVKRGVVKSLRVVALYFRAAGIGSNGNRGPAGGALVSTPISISNGTWDVKSVLGDTKVYSDGSAFFKVPARLPVYFQLLDEKNHVVQSMRSWSTLQPGENFSCVGCHENKNEISLSTGTTMAMKAGPKPLDPVFGPPRGFSFPKMVQPILDKHCIRCHKDTTKKLGPPPRRKKGAPKPKIDTNANIDPNNKTLAFSLLGTPNPDGRAKRNWSDAYLNLTQRGRPNETVNWLNVQSIPPMLPPYFAGANKSKIFEHISGPKCNVKLSEQELAIIACWIDLLVPYCGDYAEAGAWNDGDHAKHKRFMDKRRRMEAIEAANIQEMLTGKRPVGAPTDKDPPQTAAPATGYRNLALNPKDVMGDSKVFPHASTNSVCRNNPVFGAHNVINGKTANTGHGGAFPSWGPDKREDLWIKIDLGKTFEIDKIVLWIRAQERHDKHWHSATLVFSDGSKEKISIKWTKDPQTFKFKKRKVKWVKFTELVQKKPLGWCAFSEVQIWGQ